MTKKFYEKRHDELLSERNRLVRTVNEMHDNERKLVKQIAELIQNELKLKVDLEGESDLKVRFKTESDVWKLAFDKVASIERTRFSGGPIHITSSTGGR